MALPKTFTGGERLFANDLNDNFENLDGRVSVIENAPQVPSVPSGAVFWFAAQTPPNGYLKCNGAAVSRSTYAALFEVVGVAFGPGDGSTTFNLPDLRGEFVRGWDDGRGIDSGRAFGSGQGHLFASHSHATVHRTGEGTQRYSPAAQNTGTITVLNTESTGGAETRPRNVALLACIKI